MSLTAPALAIRISGGTLESLQLAQEAFGARSVQPVELMGGDGLFNAARIQEVLKGEASGLSEAICANAACALWIAGAAEGPREGFALAKESLRSGRALGKLQALRAFSKETNRDLAV